MQEKYDPMPLLRNAQAGLQTAAFSLAWLLGTDEKEISDPEDAPDLTEHELKVLTALCTRISEVKATIDQFMAERSGA